MEQNLVNNNIEPLVSLIVPVFNTGEKLLRNCIESMRNQTWSNLEIILVDDCSTNEATLQLLQEYQQKDSRIKVLRSPENSGQGLCRNLGEEACNGEFLSFIDSDDILANEFVSRCVEVMQENHTDFAMSEVIMKSENNSQSNDKLYYNCQDIPFISTQEILANVDIITIQVAVHGKFFRTQSYRQANLKFESKTRNWEDNFWTWLCFFKLKSISMLSYIGYHRLMHNISYSQTKSISKALSALDCIFQLYRFWKYVGYKVSADMFLLFANKYCEWAFFVLTPKADRMFILQYMFFTLKRCGFSFELTKNKAEKLIKSYQTLLRLKNDTNDHTGRHNLAANLRVYQLLIEGLNELNLEELPPLDEETYFKYYVELYLPEDWL